MLFLGSLPSPPTEVSATLTPNAIKVTWGRPAKNKDKVKWYRVNIASSTKAKPTQHVLVSDLLTSDCYMLSQTKAMAIKNQHSQLGMRVTLWQLTECKMLDLPGHTLSW